MYKRSAMACRTELTHATMQWHKKTMVEQSMSMQLHCYCFGEIVIDLWHHDTQTHTLGTSTTKSCSLTITIISHH